MESVEFEDLEASGREKEMQNPQVSFFFLSKQQQAAANIIDCGKSLANV